MTEQRKASAGLFALVDSLESLAATAHRGRGAALRGMLRRYARSTAGVIVAMFGATLCEAVGILSLLPLLQVAFDDAAPDSGILSVFRDVLTGSGFPVTFGSILVVAIVGLLMAQLLLFLCVTYVGFVSSRFGSDMRLALVEALTRADGGYLLSRPVGVYAALLSTETNRASGAYIATCNFVVHTISFAVLTASAFLVDWRITVAAIAVGAIMLFVLRGFLSMSRDAGYRITSQMSTLLAQVADGFATIKPLKAMGEEGRLVTIMRTSILALDRAQRKQVVSKNGIAAAQDALVLVALGLGVYASHSIANYPLSTLIVLAVLFHRATSMVGQLQKDYQGILNSEAGLARLLDAIAEARESREIRNGEREVEFRKSIRISDVEFTYGSQPVLSGVSLEIPANELVVITGASGAGKTTLVDLIVGLHMPTRGSVEIDGVPISEVSMAHWRRRIGYVPQEAVLFHDSVRNNITLGDSRYDADAVTRALSLAGASEFVALADGGLESIVGERGGKLSGGQRQRIAIARALVREPQLLILDEPTAALDSETERQLCRTLADLARTTTVLAISHRPALVDVADRVYRLEAGRVVAQGTEPTPELRAGLA
jgi:ATP-binding cassette subfamily C protein